MTVLALAVDDTKPLATLPVNCLGYHRGQRCNKLLAKHLWGTVHLKCPRCGTVRVYENRLTNQRPIV